MANIEIKYRRGYCTLSRKDYCDQCHTSAADYLGCKMFNEGKHDEMTIPFGDCVHAAFEHLYKGMTVKRYELEPYTDSYNPYLECMLLHAGGKTYECLKITLDGLTVYDTEASEEPPKIFYICDGQRDRCKAKSDTYCQSFGLCHYTTDINHAKNFSKLEDGSYWEDE